jgi:L-malate glycosyltransferase
LVESDFLMGAGPANTMQNGRRRQRRVICQLLHHLDIGGAEVLAARLARRLGQNYRFVFICLDRLGALGEQLRGEGFAVHVLDRTAGVDWRCAIRLARILRREKVELVQAHQYTPFFYAMLARLCFRRPGVLFTEHGRHHPDYRRPKRVLANRLLIERRDRIVCVGRSVKQAVVDNEGIPEARIQVIYNGVDLVPLRRNAAVGAQVRRELKIASAAVVLVQVARLDYLKDHAAALRAVALVVSRRAEVELLLVGEGPERSKIETLVQQTALTNHVRFLGQRTDVGRLLSAADIFLLTSLSEGIPLTVIEAMAAELPVVSTRVGGLAEVVVQAETGMLTPPGDDDALAKCILRLAASPELGREMGRKGAERADALFSETKMHAGYARVYAQMLNG